MKRIRRRPNTTRTSSGRLSSLRRSVSHPASRRESLVPAIAAAVQNSTNSTTGIITGAPNEEMKPLMKDTSIQLTDDQHIPDLEAAAGCPTFEKPKKKISGSISTRVSVRVGLGQQKLSAWCLACASNPVRTLLVLHTLACTYSLWCIYFYWRFYGGWWSSLFITTGVAFLFTTSICTALILYRSSNLELQSLLDQEGRSRAILNTLYPTRVLQQMYQELEPHQISEAQQQQAQQRQQNLEQSLNLSSRSFMDFATSTETTPPSPNNTNTPPSRSPPRRTPSSSRRLSLKKSTSFRKQLSFERKQETGEVNVMVVGGPSLDDKTKTKLGYEDTSYNNNYNCNNSKKTNHYNSETTTIMTATTADDEEIICIRRNSLTLRRRSMSRRHSLANSANTHNTNNSNGNNTPTHSSSAMATAATIAKRMSIGLGGAIGMRAKRRSSAGSTRSVSSNASSTGKPIQERFPHTTVLFADIAGFTKWCSEREPCHVFHLLESVFFSFDNLAKNLGVYKIETIGDCYVAVTGIPKPMDGHAAAMALFASQIILEFDMVVKDLALEAEDEGGLGADTATLRLRVGCHSGPVTAGVLRGDKGRFQLFGDTVNTTARMESNGLPGKVQISQEMAQYLEQDGKSNWYEPRADKISAKGKGELNTYWLKDDLLGQELHLQQPASISKETTTTTTTKSPSTDSEPLPPEKSPSNHHPQLRRPTPPRATKPELGNKKADSPPSRPKRQSLLLTHDEDPILHNTRRLSTEEQKPSMWLKLEKEMTAPEQRLAEWNFKQLELLVKKIKAHHTASEMDASQNDWGDTSQMMDDCWDTEQPLQYEEFDGSILEELRVDTDRNVIPSSKNIKVNHERVVLPSPVVLELQNFVKALEANYQNQNPFSNFNHACHMTRSVVQLLEHLEKQNSYGVLNKDPMAQFVIVLTCMVSEVDHPGVTNEQLIKEDAEMAEYFHNTCLTQQNALDVAWELLVGPTCENLLQAICSHSAMELERFRKYMLHAMLATDREDKILAQERFNRWMEVANPTGVQRKSTWQQSIAVIEQCMQMSNLIHTVQTRQIFEKWNERCFREQYMAYIKGRRDQDPCETYYSEQMELMKRSVIPLAERFQKTHNNAMMGSCEELQRQAKTNLEVWKATGKERVKDMSAGAKYEFGERQEEGTIKNMII